MFIFQEMILNWIPKEKYARLATLHQSVVKRVQAAFILRYADQRHFRIQELDRVEQPAKERLRLRRFAKTNGPLNDISNQYGNIALEKRHSKDARLWRTSNFFLYVLYDELLTVLNTTRHHVFIQVFYFPPAMKRKKRVQRELNETFVFFANHPPSSIYYVSVCLSFFSIVLSPSIGSLVQFSRAATCITHQTAFIIINKYIIYLAAVGNQAIDRPTDRSPADL